MSVATKRRPRGARDVEVDTLRLKLRESERERQRLHDLVHPPSVHEAVARAIHRATGGGIPFARRGSGVTVSASMLASVALDAIAEIAEPVRIRAGEGRGR